MSTSTPVEQRQILVEVIERHERVPARRLNGQAVKLGQSRRPDEEEGRVK
jgi:hypothetical protein